MTRSTVGVVISTHNSMFWLDALRKSIAGQTRLPDAVCVVDDGSTDGTYECLASWADELQSQGTSTSIQKATTTAADLSSRISQNFTQGMRTLSGVDLIALSDHDDVWLPDRLETQSRTLDFNREVAFLASNGLVDSGTRTLFDAFDVPQTFNEWTSVERLTYVLRTSVATGGASMVRARMLTVNGGLCPPPGWLHDRWWSIVGASRGGLMTAKEPVIDYRVSTEQVVGLSRGRQSAQGLQRLRAARVGDLRKLADLHALGKQAAPELKEVLSWRRLAKTVV